LSGVGMKTCF